MNDEDTLTEEELLTKINAYECLTNGIENKLTSLHKEIKEFENIFYPFLTKQIDISSTLTDKLVTYLSIFYTNASCLLDHIWFLDSGHVDNWYKENLARSECKNGNQTRKQKVGGKTIHQILSCYHVADETMKITRSMVKNVPELTSAKRRFYKDRIDAIFDQSSSTYRNYIRDDRYAMVDLVERMGKYFKNKLWKAIKKSGNEISRGDVDSGGRLCETYIEIVSPKNDIIRAIKRDKKFADCTAKGIYLLDQNLDNYIEWKHFKKTPEYLKCLEVFQRQTPNRDKKTIKEIHTSKIGKMLEFESDGEDEKNDLNEEGKSYEDCGTTRTKRKMEDNTINSPVHKLKKVCTTKVVTTSSRINYEALNSDCGDARSERIMEDCGTTRTKRKMEDNTINSPVHKLKKVCTTKVVTTSSRINYEALNSDCGDARSERIMEDNTTDQNKKSFVTNSSPENYNANNKDMVNLEKNGSCSSPLRAQNMVYQFLDPEKSPNSNFPKMSEVLRNATFTILSELNKVTTLGQEITDLCKSYQKKHQMEASIVEFLINMAVETRKELVKRQNKKCLDELKKRNPDYVTHIDTVDGPVDKMVLHNNIKNKIIYSVEKAVTMIGQELFTSMHQNLQDYDYQSLKEIIDSTVEDLPKIMGKLGVSADITNVVNLATSLKNNDPECHDVTQTKYRLFRNFVKIEEEKKKEIYHKKIVSLAKSYFRLMEGKQKKVKPSTACSSVCQKTSTLSKDISSLKVTDTSDKSSNDGKLGVSADITNVSDILDRDSDQSVSNDIQEVAHPSKDRIPSEELITLKISSSFRNKLKALLETKNQTMKDLSGNSKSVVRKMFEYLNSILESNEIVE